jgi:photosystem II stability/assembly factor-like uncharacterized protein
VDGVNWTPVKIPTTVGNGYHLITVSALDIKTVWVTGINFTAHSPRGEILFTKDGGVTWEQQACPVDSMLRRISFVGSPK